MDVVQAGEIGMNVVSFGGGAWEEEAGGARHSSCQHWQAPPPRRGAAGGQTRAVCSPPCGRASESARSLAESAQIEGVTVVNLKKPACFTSESHNPSHGVLLPSSWFAGRPCTVTAYTGPGRIHGPDSIMMIRAGTSSL